MSPVERLVECPVCRGTSLARLPVPGHWIGQELFEPHADALGLNRCRGCGFVFVNPRPSEALLRAFYAGDDYVCHVPDHSAAGARKAAARLAVVRRLTGVRSGRLLDYGCGGGELLRAAREAGWEAEGFDIGRAALAACRRQGLPVTDDPAALARRRFDVIFLSHVFEHVADHREVLGRLGGLLAPGGHLCLEVPNARSLRAVLSLPVLSRHLRFDERYRAFPIHLSYFSERTLPRLLVAHGFVVTGLTTIGLGVEELVVRDEPPRAAAHSALAADPARRRRSRAGRLVRDGFKRVFFGLGLGENLVVVARHPGEAAARAQAAQARSSAGVAGQ
jgi:SAM-dependent methyltransferase